MLIVVEGCVGAGKTTVARGLATIRGSNLLLEDFELNPFLRAFYADPVEHALEAEFAFLLLHYHQIKQSRADDNSLEVVADFHLGKDLIYTELNMHDVRAKELFRDLHDLCAERVPQPDLMIFLSAPDDLILRRIYKRNRDFELEIDPIYFRQVNTAYERRYDGYTGRKIRIPMDTWDFVEDPGLYAHLDVLINGEFGAQ